MPIEQHERQTGPQWTEIGEFRRLDTPGSINPQRSGQDRYRKRRRLWRSAIQRQRPEDWSSADPRLLIQHQPAQAAGSRVSRCCISAGVQKVCQKSGRPFRGKAVGNCALLFLGLSDRIPLTNRSGQAHIVTKAPSGGDYARCFGSAVIDRQIDVTDNSNQWSQSHRSMSADA